MKVKLKNPYKILLIIVTLFILSTNCVKQKLINILVWTPMDNGPFKFIEVGKHAFVSRNCEFQNCYLTNERNHLKNITDFDALLFSAMHLNMTKPKTRKESQRYVFVGLEPAAEHPISREYNGFFNATMTYKLNSDVVAPYIIVKDRNDEVIGPKRNMFWEYSLKEMVPTSAEVIDKLQDKSIAAVWVSNNKRECSKREQFARDLNRALSKYGQRLDIYGPCGDSVCPKTDDINIEVNDCGSLIERDYYFYLAMENSFCEDYVTGEVLRGLNNFAVPIVYGGANYTKFLPNGIYLDASTLGVNNLAKEMYDIIRNRTRYYSLFKWHGYYSFNHASENDYHEAVCGLCAFLNNKNKVSKPRVYIHIAGWWNNDLLKRIILKNETDVINKDNGSKNTKKFNNTESSKTSKVKQIKNGQVKRVATQKKEHAVTQTKRSTMKKMERIKKDKPIKIVENNKFVTRKSYKISPDEISEEYDQIMDEKGNELFDEFVDEKFTTNKEVIYYSDDPEASTSVAEKEHALLDRELNSDEQLYKNEQIKNIKNLRKDRQANKIKKVEKLKRFNKWIKE